MGFVLHHFVGLPALCFAVIFFSSATASLIYKLWFQPNEIFHRFRVIGTIHSVSYLICYILVFTEFLVFQRVTLVFYVLYAIAASAGHYSFIVFLIYRLYHCFRDSKLKLQKCTLYLFGIAIFITFFLGSFGWYSYIMSWRSMTALSLTGNSVIFISVMVCIMILFNRKLFLLMVQITSRIRSRSRSKNPLRKQSSPQSRSTSTNDKTTTSTKYKRATRNMNISNAYGSRTLVGSKSSICESNTMSNQLVPEITSSVRIEESKDASIITVTAPPMITTVSEVELVSHHANQSPRSMNSGLFVINSEENRSSFISESSKDMIGQPDIMIAVRSTSIDASVDENQYQIKSRITMERQRSIGSEISSPPSPSGSPMKTPSPRFVARTFSSSVADIHQLNTKQIGLVKTITKHTVLVSVVFSIMVCVPISLALLITYGDYSIDMYNNISRWFFIFERCVEVSVVYLGFAPNKPLYERCCKGCHWSCNRMCSFIAERNVAKHREIVKAKESVLKVNVTSK